MKELIEEQAELRSGSFSRLELATWGLLEQAERERRRDRLLDGVALPPVAVLEVLRAQWADANGLSPQQWFGSSGVDAEALDALVSRAWRWQRWCEERFSGSLNSYYLSRKAGLDRVCFWQLELFDGDFASELYQRLREGEVSFEVLTQEFAMDDAVTVCRLGPMPMGELPAELCQTLQKLQIGALLAPRLVGPVWQILHLLSKEAQPLSAALRSRLLGEMGETALSK